MTIKRTKTGNGKFVVGEPDSLTSFDSQVRSITLNPEVDKGDSVTVLSGENAPGDRTESWTIEGTLLNDFGQADSLVEFCYQHRGKTMPFQFTPATATGKEITGELVIEATQIGGDVGETPETDFSFDVVGTPVIGSIVG